MYVYLFTVPRDLWDESIKFFFESMTSESLRETLLLTANYDPQQDYFRENVKKTLLTVLANNLDFELIILPSSTKSRRKA